MTREEQLACLTDRPCNVCKFHKENGCCKWNCVFEEKPDDVAGDLISRKAVLELRKYNLVGGIHTVDVADIEKLPTYSADGDLTLPPFESGGKIDKQKYYPIGSDYSKEKIGVERADGDFISRKAVIEAVDKNTKEVNGEIVLTDDITCILEELPTIPQTENPTKDIDSAIEYWKSVDEDNNMVKWLSELREYKKGSKTDSVLEDIKAEIEIEIKDCIHASEYDAWWNGKKYGLETAIEILYKHISGKEKE